MFHVFEEGFEATLGSTLLLLEHALRTENVGQTVAQLGHVVGVIIHGGVDPLLKAVERFLVVLGNEFPISAAFMRRQFREFGDFVLFGRGKFFNQLAIFESCEIGRSLI